MFAVLSVQFMLTVVTVWSITLRLTVVDVVHSVPDLSEYSVQVGLLHLNSSALHPRLRIAHVVCGPEDSNLALLKLAQ